MKPANTSTQTDPQSSSRSPWLYVPTAYFAEGLPYVIVNTVSTVMYKNLGVPNTLIGLTSLLYLPWVLKPLWGPTVDLLGTKRNWILWMQITMAVLLALVGGILHLPTFFHLSLLLFVFVAFTSSTHDIAVDGFYLLALPPEKQAFFVGIRATAYRLAMIFGTGVLVVIAGRFETQTGNIPLSWTFILVGSGVLMAVIFLYHAFALPRPASDHKVSAAAREKSIPFLLVFKTYFQQRGIASILAYIVLYRLGEAMLVKMASPFLLDTREAGGLALATETVGYVYGTVGVLSLVIGGILGGWLISKFGLRKCMWPMALAINVPDLNYVYMATIEPTLETIYALVAVEQFGYGIGFSAFMVFLMYTARGEYKTSHFAISTGFMALGMMLPGLVSGYLQNALGYHQFFIAVCLLTIPGMLTIFFLPKEVLEAQKN